MRSEQNRKSTGSARGLGVHGGNATQFRIDLGQKRAQMELLGKLPRIEISDRARVDFARVDLRVVNCFPAGLRDQIADRFAFLLQVALKIGSAAAENVNRFVHTCCNLSKCARLSS